MGSEMCIRDSFLVDDTEVLLNKLPLLADAVKEINYMHTPVGPLIPTAGPFHVL